MKQFDVNVRGHKAEKIRLVKCRIILVLIIAYSFAGNSVSAKPVDEAIALLVGRNYMVTKYGESFSKMRILEYQPYRHLYIIKPDFGYGFVIVAADDRFSPIVAYSKNGIASEHIPKSIDLWLSDYDRQIDFSFGDTLPVPQSITEAWDNLLSESIGNIVFDSYDVIPAMINTTWSQAPYYNNQCPTGTYTGCVATAMAQIMKYWNHPFVGIGQHSYQHSTYGIQTAYFNSTYYDWDDMPNSLNANSSIAQISATATLMYHCGVSVEMNYGTDGSGAALIAEGGTTPCAESALVSYFDYRESIRGLNRRWYTTQTWDSLLYQELYNGRPVLYSGEGTGAHAFIIDGVDNANRYHINWGWGGVYDGFFLLDAMYPTNNASQNNYSLNHRAIIGIEPNSLSLKSSPASITLPNQHGIDTIWVRSNPLIADRWEAATGQTWVHLSPTDGLGGGMQTMLLISTDSNESGNMRTANIDITQGVDFFSIRIQQSDGVHNTSGWYGTDTGCAIFFIFPTQEYFIRPEAFGNFQRGSQLVKVKYNIYDDSRNRADSITVRVYEDNVLPINSYDSRAHTLGQIVYTQNVPITQPGTQEIILDIPYIITDKNFWVSIQPSDTLVLWMSKNYIPDTIPFNMRNQATNLSGAYLSADQYWVNKMYGFDCISYDTTYVRQYNWMTEMSVFVNTDTRYILQVQSSNNFMGNVSTVSGEYDNMSTVNFSAEPASGYRFLMWSDGVMDNPRTLTIWKDTSIVAFFEQDNYTLNLDVLPDSNFGCTIGGGNYPMGTTVHYGAIAFDGYKFSHWSDSVSENPRQILISSNINMYAIFIPEHPDTIMVHDTNFIMINDTITIYNTDTLELWRIDTCVVYRVDTIYIDHYIYDTVFVHDTIYVTGQGIEYNDGISVNVYTNQGQIVIDGTYGNTVTLFDIDGRIIDIKRDDYMPLRFNAPASGIYMIKIGDYPARKVLVVR